MGRNNRERRAAKARKRARSKHRGGAGGGAQHEPRHQHQGYQHQGYHQQGSDPRDRDRRAPTVTEWLVAAIHLYRSGDLAALDVLLDRLEAQPPAAAAPQIAAELERLAAALWDHGWQPADVPRVVLRATGKAEAALAARVVCAQAAGYAELGRSAAPEWMAQVDALGPVHHGGRPYLLSPGRTWRATIAESVRLAALLLSLPPLPRLAPPPSQWRRGVTVPAGSLPSDLLDKVRALLAKAESTSFEAEAEAFTAKAQELMARYRIDRAVIDAASPDRNREPAGRRIGVDDPYADAKATLLAGIAEANGCRAVWAKDLGSSTVFGLPSQLAATEELFTSLLVQATSALRREGSKRDRYGGSRTTRYRRSFLTAFAARIAHRLRDTVDATVAAATAESGAALLPILAADDERVEAAARKAFPNTRTFAPSATDYEGWSAGTRFADQADLSLGPEIDRASA